jgi:hypothetical protein
MQSRWRRLAKTDERKLTMNNPLDFSGKVAFVTGAAAGMGLATAGHLLKQAQPWCWLISKKTR